MEALAFVFFSIVCLLIGTPLFLFLTWILNKYCFHNKFKLWHRILASFGLPILISLIVFTIAACAPYSEASMNRKLHKLNMSIDLPKYKIVKYTNTWGPGDDIKDSYILRFKEKSCESLIPILDSLCESRKEWRKAAKYNAYMFNNGEWEDGGNIESFTIFPNGDSAIYDLIKW